MEPSRTPTDQDVSQFIDLPTSFVDPQEPICAQADYFDGQLKLRAISEAFPTCRVLCNDPLILELQPGAYLVAFKFGGVVLWGCRDSARRLTIARICTMAGVGKLDERVRDQLAVSLGAPEDRVSFKKLYLRKLTVEHLKIVSSAISKSAGLESFELAVAEALGRAEPVVAKLKTAGGLLGRERDILKTVGFALEVRRAILSSLELFDEPPEAWTSETLSGLHNELCNHFELKERASAIEKKLSFLNDLNLTIGNLLATRQSHRLEWIVIALIVIEVLFTLHEFFFRG